MIEDTNRRIIIEKEKQRIENDLAQRIALDLAESQRVAEEKKKVKAQKEVAVSAVANKLFQLHQD